MGSKKEYVLFISILILIWCEPSHETVMNGSIMFDFGEKINPNFLSDLFTWYRRQKPLSISINNGELNFLDFSRPPLYASTKQLEAEKLRIEANRTFLMFGTESYFGLKLTNMNISTPTGDFMNYIPIFKFPFSLHISIIENIYAHMNKGYKTGDLTTLVVMNSMIVEPLQPWKRINPLDIFLKDLPGNKYFIFYNNNAATIAARIHATNIDFIILMLDSSATVSVLRAAEQLNLLRWNRRWLIYLFFSSYVNIHQFPADYRSENITTVQFAAINSSYTLKDSMSCAAYDSLDITLRLMNEVFLNKTSGVETFEGITGNFTFDIGKLDAMPPTQAAWRNSWIMRVYQGLGKNAILVGNVSGTPNSTVMTLNLPSYSKVNLSQIDVRQPFRNNPFRIITIIEEPFVYYKSNASLYPEMKDKLQGLVIDIVKTLMESLNVSYTIHLEPTGVFGSLQANGRWNGMIGEIVDGRADMAASTFIISTDRKRVVDFLTSFMSINGAILYKESETDAIAAIFEFYFPFTSFVWGAIGGAILATIIVLTIVHYISPNEKRFGIIDSTFFTIGSLTQGEIPVMPSRHSSTIVVCFWWFFSLMTVITFVCNIGAYRVQTKEQNKITGLPSLPNVVEYQYGTVRGTVYEDMLLATSDEYLKKINKMMRHEFNDGLIENANKGVQLVKNSKFAFIWDSPVTQYYAYTQCLNSVGNFDKFGYAFAVTKHSDYKDLWNEHLTYLKDRGNISLIFEKYVFLDGRVNASCQYITGSVIANWFKSVTPRVILKYFSSDAVNMEKALGIFAIIIGTCAFVIILTCLESGVRVYMRKLVDKRGDAINKNESHA